MDTIRPKRVPWKSREDFTAWAQDFSLMQKVLGGFLGVVILVGLATSFIGTRFARETIMEEARMRLFTDVNFAGFILKSAEESVDTQLRFMATSTRLRESLAKGDIKGVRERLATVSAESDLDFLSVADDKGRIIARGAASENKAGEDVSEDPMVAEALKGRKALGMQLLPVARLAEENPSLGQRIGKPRDGVGMVIEAAFPVVIEKKIAAVVYGGMVLNNNNLIADRIADRLFKGGVYARKPIGYVTIYQGPWAVSTTLKGDKGLPLVGSQAGEEIQANILDRGGSEITEEIQLETVYLTAVEPLRDYQGKIVGAIQVATQKKPVTTVIDRLVATFMFIALMGVILMAAITYLLVKWINWPMEQMLHAARKAADGDLSHEVPVIARDEVGELAATFNLMIRNLAASRNRLEEWGKQLASKVAEQTGELDQAREQVARVKKLASLEKMADGMANVMANISDPRVRFPATEDTTRTTVKVLVLDTDESVLEICKRILESEGFDVRTTTSTKEALEQLEKEFFDVIIADIDLPDIGGKELLKEIKNRQPEVIVILTAPFKATEEAVEAVSLGAYDYIPKPFGPHQILLVVYTAVQAREMLQQTRKQHAEQRAETIFQGLPVAIALADDENRVVYHNKAFIRLASVEGQGAVTGKSFKELFGIDPLESVEKTGGSKWLQLEKVGRTAKLYNFKLPEEDLRVLMLLDVTETVMKDQQADVLKAETISKAQQVIHQQMRVAQEIAGLLGETTAETKAALFELIKLAGELGEPR